MKLMIFDANSIINRAFYGIRLLSTAEGIYTNAVYGFINIYLRFRQDEQPDCVCAAFDMRAPTFRHKEYADYKAGRRPMPDELASQIPLMKDVLKAMGVPIIECEGYEADDIIGTVAARCEKNGDRCVIVTGDRDSLQLVSDMVTVRLVGNGGSSGADTITPARLFELHGLTPDQMKDLKALMGDSSDNIPGVPGIGEKTAKELLYKYGTLDNIYKDVDALDVKPGVKKKLADGRESAYKSLWLGTIDRDAPIPVDICDISGAKGDEGRLYELFKRLEFGSFIVKMGLSPKREAPAVSRAPAPEAEHGTDPAAVLGSVRKSGLCAFLIKGEDIFFPSGDGVCVLPAVSGGIADIMADGSVKKLTHDLKGAMTALGELGVGIEGECFDTMIAAYLLDPSDGRYELTRLIGTYLSEEPDGGSDEAAFCAAALPRLMEKLSSLIEKNGQHELFWSCEMPLCRVLYDMERYGFKVDKAALADFGGELDGQIEQTQSEIFRLCGCEFNINSPKQLGAVLFEKLGLPVIKKTKTGYSTDVDVLNKLAPYNDAVGLIIEYRHLTKLKSTYVDGLLPLIDDRTGRIHSSFNQTVTQTGRISSTEPNLQNIPVRLKMGQRIRRVFVPQEGYTLVDADYSQIELRVLAHMADDGVMKRAFAEGVDIHTLTASSAFGVPVSGVTHEMRSKAKAVNFGIVYGIGDFSLADDIKVTRKEARAYIDAYLATYSGVAAYMKNVVERANEDGFVTTLLGRRRYLPELKSKNRSIREFGKRCAMNTPIQGTAADIIKLAMVRVHDRLKREGLSSRLILQVHDELIVETKKGESDRVRRILDEEMRGAMPLSVELEVDINEGDNWLAAKE